MKEKIKQILHKEVRGAIKIGGLITIGLGVIFSLITFVYEITVSSLKDSDSEIKLKINNVEAKNAEQENKINEMSNNWNRVDQRLKNIENALGVPKYKIQ